MARRLIPIEIVVRGKTKSGKTTLSLIVEKCLRDLGANVVLKEDMLPATLFVKSVQAPTLFTRALAKKLRITIKSESTTK